MVVERTHRLQRERETEERLDRRGASSAESNLARPLCAYAHTQTYISLIYIIHTHMHVVAGQLRHMDNATCIQRERARASARTDVYRTSFLLQAYLWALARLSRGGGPVPRMPWPGAKGLVRSRDLRLEGVATGSSEVNCSDPRVVYGRRQRAGQHDDACTKTRAMGNGQGRAAREMTGTPTPAWRREEGTAQSPSVAIIMGLNAYFSCPSEHWLPQQVAPSDNALPIWPCSYLRGKHCAPRASPTRICSHEPGPGDLVSVSTV